MTGAIATGTGFSASEIDQMDGPDLTYWWNAIMAWRETEAELAKNG